MSGLDCGRLRLPGVDWISRLGKTGRRWARWIVREVDKQLLDQLEPSTLSRSAQALGHYLRIRSGSLSLRRWLMKQELRGVPQKEVRHHGLISIRRSRRNGSGDSRMRHVLAENGRQGILASSRWP